MSIVVRFTPVSATTEQYDESIRRLKESAPWPHEGLEYHVAFGSGSDFRVSEIWDTQEQLDAFGERLTPLLAEIGIELAGSAGGVRGA
jgi:hypothetical protein